MNKNAQAKDIALLPFAEMASNVRKILAVSKPESDRQMKSLQAANVKRREAKKRKP